MPLNNNRICIYQFPKLKAGGSNPVFRSNVSLGYLQNP